MSRGAWPIDRSHVDRSRCPGRNGVRCWKNLRIDSSHRNFDYPEKVGVLGKLAKRADIEINGHIISVCAYMRNAPNNECLGQQNSMRLNIS